MKITLHIGVPKTGSTAIQAHLSLNRGWFQARKIAIPTTGFSDGFGHVLLFEDTTTALLGDLKKELAQLEADGTDHALITWEGLNMFSLPQVETVADFLQGHAVTVLAYLRDQTEVIQSGYLQAIKQRRQRRILENYQDTDILIKPQHINYESLLGRYATAFGAGNVNIRVYERDRLIKGNIVVDFLDALGLEPDEEFILAKSEQNISLDVGSARILNVLDSLYSSSEDRDALVDLLLSHIAKHGADQKYFLPKSQVELIRSHYADSNTAVLQKYAGNSLTRSTLFSMDKNVEVGNTDLDKLAEKKFRFLNEMKDYHYWRGEALTPGGLIRVTSQGSGWSTVEPAGVWSCGEVSHLRFRICRSTISPFASTLRLSISGQYFHENKNTSVSIPGVEAQTVDLTDIALDVPLASFDSYGRISIRLDHSSAVSPYTLGMHEDFRDLAFMLQSAQFVIIE
jgi:hypothetical protein